MATRKTFPMDMKWGDVIKNGDSKDPHVEAVEYVGNNTKP